MGDNAEWETEKNGRQYRMGDNKEWEEGRIGRRRRKDQNRKYFCTPFCVSRDVLVVVEELKGALGRAHMSHRVLLESCF